MIERRLISEEEKELYLYGLQLLSEKIFGLCSMILICIILSRLFEGIVFYMAYSLLRMYAGGFHAERFIACYLSSCVTMVFCCVLSFLPFAMNVSFVTSIVAIPLILFLAPVEHSAKPLDECEVKRYKILTRLVLFCELCVFAVLFLFECYSLCFALSFAWALLSALLVLQRVKNKNSI